MISNIQLTGSNICFQALPDVAQTLKAQERTGYYSLPMNLHTLRSVYQRSKDQHVLEYGVQMRTHYDKVKAIKLQNDTKGPEQLRPYQRVDLEFLLTLRHAAIFNEQRTGKTPLTLELCKAKGHKKIFIVSPAGYITGWAKEVEKWIGINPYILKGRKVDPYLKVLKTLDSFVAIISYETLRTREIELPVDAMIVDEAHRLRGRKTKESLAVRRFGRVYATCRYALTGTPTARKFDDIWAILNFLYPEAFSSYWYFMKRYMQTYINYFTKEEESTGKLDPAMEQELQDFLFMISTNRKRAEVMPWLPKKEYTPVRLQPTDRQRTALNDLEKYLEHTDDEGHVVDVSGDLEKVMRMQQICLEPKLLGLKSSSPKTDWLLDYLKDNPKEPTIVFTKSTKYIKLLSEKLDEKGINYGVIHGEVPQKKRDKAEADFQEGKLDVILCNIKAAGVGLTLDRATVSVFMDVEWNPIDNQQAEDRMVPTSQERNHPMTVYVLSLEGTYDEHVWKIVRAKKDVTSLMNSMGARRLAEFARQLGESENAQV